MAKNIAPPKLTGGGGFVFEDKVVAYFLTCLLSNQLPLAPALGTISRIDFQTRVDGWFLDDILLTLTSQGETRQCALSVKSNQQFTKDAAPTDFVSLAWEQFLHEGTTRFETTSDLLGLVTAPLERDLYEQLCGDYGLLSFARLQDAKDLPNRLAQFNFGSELKRSLFKSFACPEEMAKRYGISEDNTGELLRCIQILPFDFEDNPSAKLQSAIQNCRNVLLSGSLEEAQSLWTKLLVIAGEYRPKAGYLNFQRLVDIIRFKFRLKDFPNHRRDWTQLLEQTKENLGAVPDKIGNVVFIPRLGEQEAIDTAFEKSKVVVILGASGCGKTVIAKSWAEKELNSSKVMWWNARSLEISDFSSFQSRLGLSHPLRDLLAAAPDPQAYIVIDGLDRIFSDTAFQNLSVVTQALRLNIETSPWRILIPCQLEEWSRLQTQLSRTNILTTQWRIIPVEEPGADDLTSVWKAFPALGRLKFQPQLQSLLLKPKVLDLLATKLYTGGSVDTTQWVGESNLIEWFWETEVCKQPNARMRAGLLKSLGEKQADNLEAETPTDAFFISDLAQVDSLISDRLCQEREERLFFCHALYGDWARQRVLLGKVNNLCEYLEPRIASPLWHRAVRLYGLHLLEKNEDITKWRSAFIALEKASQLTQDLLLEAAIFAAEPLPLLERLWPDLAANNGLLLRRLLGRFLHVATLPNPVIREIIGIDSETRSATIQRIPYWPYWLPMLRFLYGHLADVIDLAPKQVAEIADAWLYRGGEKWPMRREAAELALATAEHTLQFKQVDRFTTNKDKLDETVYHAALAGVRELPDSVAAFALEASARRKSTPQALQAGDRVEDIPRRVTIKSILGRYEVELPPPWPDGPRQSVDSEFQNVCLETCALYPLILSNPTISREVLLALLIEEPIAPDPFERHSPIGDNLEIAKVQAWEYKPPFYNRGPFLFFLQNQPTEGLEVILRLVNFATQRWAARYIKQEQTVPEVSVTLPDGDHKWIGNAAVYYWYRPHHLCPKPVAIALMALEKRLYDAIDKGESIDAIVELILERSNSLAFAGLLSTVGCKKPSLFQGILRPLLTVPEFHQWELLRSHDPDKHLWSSNWWNEGEWLLNLAREWYTLPHREHGLHEWAQWLFLNDLHIRAFFEEVRSSWMTQLKTFQEGSDTKDYLENLISRYNIKNYREENHPEYGEIWIFNPPEELLAEKEKYLKDNYEKQLLLFLPVQCRQILDKAQVISSDQLEQFWSVLQELSSFTSPENLDEVVNRVEDAVCGGAAVLLKLHCDWLRQHPEKEEWCVQQIVKTICNPPQPRMYDSAESFVSWGWEGFCAQILPMIWAEHPDLPILRECVARLALNYHYKTVEILFKSAANYRNSLGDNFKQLQHLLLRWAAMRWELDYTSSEEQADFNLEIWLQQEVEAFVQKTISPKLPLLGELSLKEHCRKLTKTHSYQSRRPKQSPGIDLILIQAAYAWLPSLEQATDANERTEWITFWKEALDCTLRMLGEEAEEEVEIQPFYDWDQWVLKHIASLLLQLHITEHPEEFWRPILGLGRRGRFWIERFLCEWFINGLSSEPASETFVKEWQAMVEFAFSSPQWHSHSFYLAEAWCNLMGLNQFTYDLWTEAQKTIIQQMHSLYQFWAEEHLKNPRCATKFIIFLKRPATEEIIFDGLIWLKEAISLTDKWFWRERDMQDWLVSLLDQCWGCHQSKLRQKQASFDAFKELLKKLADFQNPIALEIQQRVAST